MIKKEFEKIISNIAEVIRPTEFAHKTFVVGGCVRDFLLNNPLKDLDLVVNLPDGGVKLANYLHQVGLASQPAIFKSFGTAMVMINGHQIEFVMTRSENYREKSRHPQVEFASLEADAFRRDFTINALYYDICNKKLIDVTKMGISDLEKKLIRSTSDPNIIFKEDPLRVLRAIRFAGRLGFDIEEKSFQSLLKWVEQLQFISKERIKDEFLNMLLYSDNLTWLNLIFETKAVSFILPCLIPRKHQIQDLAKSLIKYPRDISLRLSLLASSISNPLDIIPELVKLTINKKIAHKAGVTGQNVQQILDFPFQDKINHFVYDNLSTLPLALEIVEKSYNPPAIITTIKDKLSLFQKIDYPVYGKNVIQALNLKNHKEINYYINQAKDIWIENPHLQETEIISMLRVRRIE